ncbi:MAG: hypothetical protein P8X54_03225 [Desulfuromonadales bacterium]
MITEPTTVAAAYIEVGSEASNAPPTRVAVAAPAPPIAAPRPALVLEEIAPTTAPVEAPTAPALAVFLATSSFLLAFAPLASAARMHALMSASACCCPTLFRWALG